MFRRPLILFLLLVFFIAIRCGLANDLNRPWNNDSVSNSNATVLSHRAAELLSKGDYAGARPFFDAAVKADPGSYLLFYNRAIYFRAVHQWDLALKDLNTCLHLKPTHLDAYVMRGAINDRLGNYKDALADYNGLIKLGRSSWMLDCRASLLATCPDASIRNGPAAVVDATAACRSDSWDYPQFIDTLAAACAETGDFDSAIRFQEKAIARARKLKWDVAGMEKRLVLYQQHQTYRETHGESSREKSVSAKSTRRD
jgi:serine/threonine-protein kinase